MWVITEEVITVVSGCEYFEENSQNLLSVPSSFTKKLRASRDT